MTRPLSPLERRIALILRTGVIASTVTMAAGLVFWFADPAAIMLLNAGLIMLMAIPISRIAASLVDAIRRRDWLLTSATACVLVVLASTIAYSLRAR